MLAPSDDRVRCYALPVTHILIIAYLVILKKKLDIIRVLLYCKGIKLITTRREYVY